jgi:hypothetical protein
MLCVHAVAAAKLLVGCGGRSSARSARVRAVTALDLGGRLSPKFMKRR